MDVVAIGLPPLRERREDIPLLIDHFLATRQIGKVKYQVHPKALQAMMRYAWPGNVRELLNVLERAQIVAEEHVISVDDLPVKHNKVHAAKALEISRRWLYRLIEKHQLDQTTTAE